MRLLIAIALLASALAPSVALADDPARDATVIAHRGASRYAPENTLPAVQLGIDMGADLVEIDIQLTADRQIILMHDGTLNRTTDVEDHMTPVDPRRMLAHPAFFTRVEYQALDAGCWGRFAPGEEHDGQYCGAIVPTLRDTLELFADHPDVGLLIEIKSPSLAGDLDEHEGIEALLALELKQWADEGHTNSHVVQSFNHQAMREFDVYQELMGLDHEVGVLGNVAESRFSDYATFADQINPSHRNLTREYVDAAHAAGFSVNPYTVNDQCRMAELISGLDVDGVITDVPDLLADVAEGRFDRGVC